MYHIMGVCHLFGGHHLKKQLKIIWKTSKWMAMLAIQQLFPIQIFVTLQDLTCNQTLCFNATDLKLNWQFYILFPALSISGIQIPNSKSKVG